jgi:hypothetical protein
MKAFWAALGALMLLAAGLFIAAVSGMVQAEIRTRLSQLPEAVIRLAVRRIPQDLREDLGEEWRSELEGIFDANQDMPVTGLTKAIWYATGLLVRGPAVARIFSGTARYARAAHLHRFLSQLPLRVAERLKAALLMGVIGCLSRGLPRAKGSFYAFLRIALSACIGVVLAEWGIIAIAAAIPFAAACGALWGFGATLLGHRCGPLVISNAAIWSIASGLGMALGGFVPLGVACLLVGAFAVGLFILMILILFRARVADA